MTAPTRLSSDRLLVVEGNDEVRFFQSLAKHMGLPSVQVLNIEGKNNLRARLKALTMSPDFGHVVRLGIVRDADQDPEIALQSVCDALKRVGLPVPNFPLNFAGSNPGVGVLILPGSKQTGALEDLCLATIAEDPAMYCVEAFFHCLTQQQLNLPANTAKAKVQAYLASRPKAGLRLGEAAEAGYWDWHSPVLDEVKNFLQKLTQ